MAVATKMADTEIVLDSEDDEMEDYTDDFRASQIARIPEVAAEKFSLSLADSNYLGFFSGDHSTQTDESEILQIKELSDNVQQLMKDAREMKRNIDFICSSMKADFERKLKEKSIDLYVKVNDKVSMLEKQHVERVDMIRRAFRQQLKDAICLISSAYANDINSKLASEQLQSSSASKRLREMEAIAKTNDATIQQLTEKLAACERKQIDTETEMRERLARQTRSASMELAACKDEITQLEAKIASMDEETALKDEVVGDMKSDLEAAYYQIDKLKREIDALNKSKEAMMNALEEHQTASSKALESQRLALEKEKEDALKQAKEEVKPKTPVPAKKQVEILVPKTSEQNGMDKEQYEKLLKERKHLEEALTKEKAESANRLKMLKNYELSQKMELHLRDQINSLKAELVVMEKNWQKKFAILQKSMFVLKDESYLRQTLQRQAATLHQAAVSYAYDGPVNVRQSASPGSNRKVLPGISRPKSSPRDYISYTVTPPADRSTFVSLDENQVLSDGEELPPDILPLPSPPPR